MSKQTPEDYLARKVNGDCVQAGCKRRQCGRTLLCEHHDAKRKEYQARYRRESITPKRRRKSMESSRNWRRRMKREKRCQDCGMPPLYTTVRCLECHKKSRVSAGRTPLPMPRAPKIKKVARRLAPLPPLRIEDFATARMEAA